MVNLAVPQYHFDDHQFHMDCPDIEPDMHGKKLAPNRLSYVAATLEKTTVTSLQLTIINITWRRGAQK
jgi:hypothetical protein